jgi:hypothetical protein
VGRDGASVEVAKGLLSRVGPWTWCGGGLDSVEISRGFLSHVGYWTGHEDYYDHAAQELYGDVVSACFGDGAFLVIVIVGFHSKLAQKFIL